MSKDHTARRSGVAAEEILGKAYDMKLMARLWRFVKPHWKLLLLSFTLIPITVGFELIQPYLLKIAIEEHIAVARLDGLGTIALIYLVFVGLQSLSSYAELYFLQLLGQRSMHDLRVALYRHVLGQRAAFFDRMPVGRLLTRMTNDVESINEMFASGVITLVADLIKLTAIIVVMLLMDVELTLMTFLTLPLLAMVVEYARRLMRASFRQIRVKLAALNSYAQEHLSGLRVVQLFGRERQVLDEYNDINAAHRDAYLGSIRADASMYALVEAIGVVGIAAIVWYASGNMSADPAAVALVVAFIEYIRKFFIPIRDLSAKYAVMQSAMAASERVMALLDTSEPDAPPVDVPHAGAPEDDAVSLRFDDVRFAYREGEDVLRGVSFTIARGQTVAVVGATGSGKSTLIKLLARLYEIGQGDIRIEGRDIRSMPVSELRRRVTVVSQDVFLFTGTVAENIRLGDPGADDDRIRQALTRVGAYRMLERRMAAQARRQPGAAISDDPLQLAVEARGSNFSAGERQLLAFARALVRDPDLLILDEATAHVDPEAEGLIEQGVAELMRGRTTLVIAHRLSTIRNAHQILVMARGHVVERGTHDELVARGGVYARLERTFSRKD
jgi:ATP-binding cassette, subfamily B, multidrug efflux pump